MKYHLHALIFVLIGTPIVNAQETVMDFLQRQSEWPEVIRAGKPITLSGRYEGRVAERFRMAQLPIRLIPLRTARLPRSLEFGQRLQVTGVLQKVGSRYTMNVSGLAVGKTDEARYRLRFEALPENDFEAGFELADEAEAVAEFYKDRGLQEVVSFVRMAVFQRQREAAKSVEDFERVITAGEKIDVSTDVLQTIRFQAILRLSQQKPRPIQEIITRLKSIGPGWDQPARLQSQDEQRFQKTPVEVYSNLRSRKRAIVHRHVYRMMMVPEILDQEQANSSNANEVAEQLLKQFPELESQAAELEGRYLAYRLQQVKALNRQQVDALIDRLTDASRETEIPAVVDKWLAEQERLRNTGGVSGRLTTADQFLYAAERWKQQQHKDRGVSLLKQVWEQLIRSEGASEAAAIEERLKSLGWERLRDRWMTTEQVRSLPSDDVDLAMKQRRIVVGMTARQVLSLGEPSRRTRIYSANTVREVWVYDEGGSSALVVHLSRATGTEPDQAIAVRVGKSR